MHQQIVKNPPLKFLQGLLAVAGLLAALFLDSVLSQLLAPWLGEGTAIVIFWALGALIAIYAMRRCKKFGLTSDDIMDLLLVGAPCGIVGARAYYVLFEWERYFVNPEHWYDFLNIRQGGIAIYGAVIGAILGLTVFYCIKKDRIIGRKVRVNT